MSTEVLQKLRTLSHDEHLNVMALVTQVRALVAPLSPDARACVIMGLADLIDAEARSYADNLESTRGQVGTIVSHSQSQGYKEGLSPSDEQFYDGIVRADNAVKNAAIERIQRIISLINTVA